MKPASNATNITAYYGPGEPAARGVFIPLVLAQPGINSVISKVIVNDPEYKALIAKFN